MIELLVAAGAFLFTFLMTVIIGGPMAAALARIQVFRQPRLADPIADRAPNRTSFFEPVDFGPVKTLWPSEMDRPDYKRPAPAWPSTKWDDPHFGKGATEMHAPAQAKRSLKPVPEPRETREEAQARSAAEQEAAQELAALQKAAQQRAQAAEQKARQQPKKRVQQRAKPAKRKPAPKPAAPAPKPAAPAPQPGAGDGENVESLVAELGLSGAVQYLMQENGWDFRKAASYIASQRKRR